MFLLKITFSLNCNSNRFCKTFQQENQGPRSRSCLRTTSADFWSGFIRHNDPYGPVRLGYQSCPSPSRPNSHTIWQPHTDHYALYKDQKSADVVRKQLRDRGRKFNHELQPIFTSKKIVDDLRETELKPPIVNQQSVVYEFKCYLCDTHTAIYTNVLRSTNIP